MQAVIELCLMQGHNLLLKGALLVFVFVLLEMQVYVNPQCDFVISIADIFGGIRFFSVCLPVNA